jgi:hypothetical protein
MEGFIVGQEKNRLATLNREAVCVAAAAAQRGDNALLHKLGIDRLCVPMLKGININALERLHSFNSLVVDIRFNAGALERMLNYLHDEIQLEDRIDRAIRLGIRQGQLRDLTGVTRREYEQRRAALGLSGNGPGRSGGLQESEELDVLRQWQSLKTDTSIDDLEKLCRIAENTGITVDRIWLTVMEGV